MKQIGYILFAAVLLASCAETKYVPDGRYLLNKVKVTVDGNQGDVNAGKMKSYVRQQENVRWFSLFKLPLGVYSLSGRDSTRWVNRLLKNMGEPPVLFDSLLARQTVGDLQQMLYNQGYLESKVELWTKAKGKKLSTTYKLYPGEAYTVGNLQYQIADPFINRELGLDDPANWGLKPGSQFSVDDLDLERKRITKLLTDRGYYRFHKEFISYEADKMPEEVLGELTADWGDAETIERSEGIFPGTTDMWGYWRTLSQPAGSEDPSRTAIAGEYNGGTLLLQNTTYLTGDDAIDTAAADALETVVDSITYENFGPQTMYEYIPGTYTAEQDGATLSVTLNEDHSGVLSIQDDIDILWGSVELMAADGSFTYEYTLEGDNLYVNYDGEWTEFARQA